MSPTPSRTPPQEARHELARRLIAVLPASIRMMRTSMRTALAAHGAQGDPELSVPALRTLIQAGQHPGIGITAVAKALGVSAASASVAAERLVRQGWLEVRSPVDRRCRALHLTPAGRELVDLAMEHTADVFAQRLATLESDDLSRLAEGIQVLDRLFAPGTEAATPAAHTTFTPIPQPARIRRRSPRENKADTP